ncbi:MAG: aminodeoxychorismate/anthranilate synthase component II [Rhodospirillales bacterium]|nr:aminodeoxychorismate/anthranilate synthase component II [Rhodospirillales bacterium]
MIILIDNYDSFTYNLVHYLGELGAEVQVHRNDQITVDEVLAAQPEGIVISPGPGTPDNAGICLDLIKRASGQIPIFGVCLGHQAIAQVFGGRIVLAPKMMHGKLSAVRHGGKGVFKGLPDGFVATRYHSLMVERESFPEVLEITAETDPETDTKNGDAVIMGLQHKLHETHGVQFHPESIASEQGHAILRNFLDRARLREPAS